MSVSLNLLNRKEQVMKLKAKTKIIIGLILFALVVGGFSTWAVQGVSLQSISSVMRVIIYASLFSAIGGIIAGQILISGVKSLWHERRERKEAKKAENQKEKGGFEYGP